VTVQNAGDAMRRRIADGRGVMGGVRLCRMLQNYDMAMSDVDWQQEN
jgi:hypothetical protein